MQIAIVPALAEELCVFAGEDQRREFAPFRILEEMLAQDLSSRNASAVFDMLLRYIAVEAPSVQSWLGNESSLPTSVAEGLGNAFLKLPSHVLLDYNIITPELRYSLAFQILGVLPRGKQHHLFRFVEYVRFLSQIYASSCSKPFLDRLTKAFFNRFLILVIQPSILGWRADLIAARTAVQYLTLILENVSSLQLATVIFYFLFGFPAGTVPPQAPLSARDTQAESRESPPVRSSFAEDDPPAQISSEPMRRCTALNLHIATFGLEADRATEKTALPLSLFADASATCPYGQRRRGKRQRAFSPARGQALTQRASVYLGSQERGEDAGEMKNGEYEYKAHGWRAVRGFVIDKFGCREEQCSIVIPQLVLVLMTFNIKPMVEQLVAEITMREPSTAASWTHAATVQFFWRIVGIGVLPSQKPERDFAAEEAVPPTCGQGSRVFLRTSWCLPCTHIASYVPA